MSLNPTVKGVLDNVLGSSFVARDRYPGVGGMDEIPRWDNPMTGQLEPIPGHQPDLGGFEVAGSYGQPSGMPDYIYESIQRQYGNKKFGDYKIEDMKNVINWHKKA